MKTVADYIKLMEDAVATNTVSGGAIATKDVPLGGKGNIAKRKPLEEENASALPPTSGDGKAKPVGTTGVDDPNSLGDTVGKDPLSTVYAPEGKGPGEFERKQQYQNDQMI